MGYVWVDSESLHKVVSISKVLVEIHVGRQKEGKFGFLLDYRRQHTDTPSDFLALSINHTSNNCRSLESEAPGPRHFSRSIIQVTPGITRNQGFQP